MNLPLLHYYCMHIGTGFLWICLLVTYFSLLHIRHRFVFSLLYVKKMSPDKRDSCFSFSQLSLSLNLWSVCFISYSQSSQLIFPLLNHNVPNVQIWFLLSKQTLDLNFKFICKVFTSCVCTCFLIEVAKVVNEKCEKIHFSVQPGDKNSKQHAISNVPAHTHTRAHWHTQR